MGVVRMIARSELRSGWRSALGLVLLVTLAGGAVLGALAAAHRTATAYDRMVADTEAFDVLVNPDFGIESTLRLDDIAALPQVAEAGRSDGVVLLPPVAGSTEEIETFPSALASDGVFGYDFARSNVREGRLPDPSEPLEVLITSEYASRSGLGAGDSLTIRALTQAESFELFEVTTEDEGRALLAREDYGELVDLRIVGVGVAPDDLIIEAGFRPIELLLTPAYWERFEAPSAGWWGAGVRLRPGADVRAFEAAVQALAPDEPIAFQTRATTTAKVDRTVQPYVVALVAFAAVAGVLGLIVIVQAVSRRARLGVVDQRAMQALGRTRGERFASATATVAGPVLVGTGGAVVVAFLVSPIAPIGAVRPAEPDPGPVFDPSVLGVGAMAWVGLVLLAAAVPLWRSTRVEVAARRPRRARAADLLTAGNAPAAMSTGVRFALEPGTGAAAVPTRGVLIGAASAVALAAALLAFGTSLGHFVDTPRLFGSDWNVIIDGNLAPDTLESTMEDVTGALAPAPQVEAFSTVEVSEIDIGGRRFPTVTFDESPSPVMPTITEGRAPRGDAEVAFGRSTAEQLGVAVGDDVVVTDPTGDDHTVTTVGIAVLPEVGTYGGSDKTSLGEGVLVDGPAFVSLAEDFDKSFVVARVAGPDPVAQADRLLPASDSSDWLAAGPAPVPAEVQNLDRLRSTPTLLLGMLVALLGAAVVHALLVAFRSRRHDVAVLQALGYRPRQVVATSLWQATTSGAIAVAIGLPIGLVVGRWCWTILVQQYDAVADPVTPILGSVALAVVVLVLVNLLGVVPGWQASRRTPAATLRAE